MIFENSFQPRKTHNSYILVKNHRFLTFYAIKQALLFNQRCEEPFFLAQKRQYNKKRKNT